MVSLYAQQEIKIGVLAKRGESHTLQKWNGLATYLEQRVGSGYRFSIVPLDFQALMEQVGQDKLDFVLTNTMYYILLEHHYNMTRIATLRNLSSKGAPLDRFGGVIFTKSGSAIGSINDLTQKDIAAVDPLSFGGWVMGLAELHQQGVDEDELRSVKFKNSHDAVVYAVLKGEVEAGMVRTDTLERMAAEGKVDLSAIKVINPRHHTGFDFLCSTALYPEWPFAKAASTDPLLANRVLSALLMISPESKAARDARIAGWAIPMDYSKVHTVLRLLEMPPYDQVPKVTLWQFMQGNKALVGALAVLFAVLLFFSLYVTQLYRKIKVLNDTLEQKVQARTGEVHALLENEKELTRVLGTILDEQENFVILSDGKELRKINRPFLDFLGFSDMQTLKDEHLCVCDFFLQEEGYLYASEEYNWLMHALDEEGEAKVKMLNMLDDREHVFVLKTAPFSASMETLYIVTFTDITDFEEETNSLKQQAHTDGLTALANRLHFEQALHVALLRHRLGHDVYSLVMFDIDHFKAVNDTYGHDAGDRVLKKISSVVAGSLRGGDLPARWGGEEFMILLHDANGQAAHAIAEKLRLKLEALVHDEVGSVTCSFGVTELDSQDSEESVVKRVDEALYAAKNGGRNRVACSIRA
jgi:phosphate/phosphite/phosphonate ABC transporter binding protein